MKDKFIYATLCVLLISLFLSLLFVQDTRNNKNQSSQVRLDGEYYSAYIPPELIIDDRGFLNNRRVIDQAILRKEFDPNNLAKLKFSVPGDSDYGADPRFEFFNPSGPFKAVLYDHRFIINAQNRQRLMGDDSKIVFLFRKMPRATTVNRIKGNNIKDVWLVVITDIANDACGDGWKGNASRIEESFDLSTQVTSQDPPLASFFQNAKKPQGANIFPICVLSEADDEWYYVDMVGANYN